MTEKRERISTDPGLGPLDPPGPSTLRSLDATDEVEAISPGAPVYYEPSPLIPTSDHRTLEIQTVKLSDDIDPRKLATELRLDRVPTSYIPPSDSFWPPETALSSSQPPAGPVRRWRTPVVLISLLAALLLLVLARAVTQRSNAAAQNGGIAQTVSGAGLAPLALSAVPAATPPVAPAASAAPMAAPSATAVVPPAPSEAPAPSVTALAPVAVPRSALVPPHALAKPTLQTSAALEAPSASKPKRAIY